jgi:hypothetical protein
MNEFRTRENTVSVFVVDSERKNAARILSAIMSAKDAGSGLIATDCLIFASESVEALGIPIREEPGLTPDMEANKWHRDLADLSADRLVKLAEVLVKNADLHAVLEGELVEALKGAAANGELQKEKLSSKVLPLTE